MSVAYSRSLDIVETLLIYAARGNSDPEVIKTLIEAGAEVDKRAEYKVDSSVVIKDSKKNYDEDPHTITGYKEPTALIIAAAYNKNPDVLQALIDAEADISLANSRGKRAVDFAKNNPNIAKSDVYSKLHEGSF